MPEYYPVPQIIRFLEQRDNVLSALDDCVKKAVPWLGHFDLRHDRWYPKALDAGTALIQVISYMKIIIKNQVHCDYDNLRKYLPARYVFLVPKCHYGEIVNLVSFPGVKNAVTGNEVLKAQKKLTNTESKTFYIANCFTPEALQIISESSGTAFYFREYPWNDESCKNFRNSISCGIHGGKI